MHLKYFFTFYKTNLLFIKEIFIFLISKYILINKQEKNPGTNTAELKDPIGDIDFMNSVLSIIIYPIAIYHDTKSIKMVILQFIF